ncbi:kinase-like domain-containing protein [Mycena rebaudengoi]|nr:kinase-like domain-containing protein [Mycena rebaudengoi]
MIDELRRSESNLQSAGAWFFNVHRFDLFEQLFGHIFVVFLRPPHLFTKLNPGRRRGMTLRRVQQITTASIVNYWHALPWERELEARLQLAESSSLTALVILFLHELHHDTFGRWVQVSYMLFYSLIFDVEGLRRLAAQSVGRSPADVVNLSKLAEGGFNRTFLITLRDDFQMVARIPYPATLPKYYAVASEVATISVAAVRFRSGSAQIFPNLELDLRFGSGKFPNLGPDPGFRSSSATMEFLRSSGLPVPQVYGYSPVSDNAAKTEYIFMEFMRGTKLSNVWLELGESDIVSILRQLAQLEAQMMSISFPAGGSLYYAHDLEKVAGRVAIPLKDERFCVGPDTRLPMWYGRRSQVEADRGPYKSAEAALIAARKELAYLEQFGQPLLPFRRERRDGYQYQEQSPLAHIENLKRYLIASSLVPRDPALGHFCIRHPDLQQSNIVVRRSSDSGWQVVSLLDWQHASLLPLFLLAGVPQRLQNHAEEVYRRRLVHYHYVTNTEEYNKPHYDALTDPMCVLRSRLFHHANNPWEGETLELKVALIRATERWETLTGGGAPCPVVFDAEDVRATTELNEVQRKADKAFAVWQDILDLGPEGWVPTQDYKEAVALCKRMKEEALTEATSEEERAEIMAHWPWDDMDEGKYL